MWTSKFLFIFIFYISRCIHLTQLFVTSRWCWICPAPLFSGATSRMLWSCRFDPRSFIRCLRVSFLLPAVVRVPSTDYIRWQLLFSRNRLYRTVQSSSWQWEKRGACYQQRPIGFDFLFYSKKLDAAATVENRPTILCLSKTFSFLSACAPSQSRCSRPLDRRKSIVVVVAFDSCLSTACILLD